MTYEAARKWFGMYFLLTTTIMGCYLLFFSGPFLALNTTQANDSFKILIPVLIGQITVIFQWIARANETNLNDKKICPVPTWAIKTPPTLAIFIIVLASVILYYSNKPQSNWSFSPETFKSAITFAVTILNASTIYLVPKIFHK